MRIIYKSGRMVRYKTEKGNIIEIYKERIAGKNYWFISGITNKKIYNCRKDFHFKKDAVKYAMKFAKARSW